MFKTIAAIFLLVAFAAQTFNRTLMVLDYYSNTAAFAKNCENIARPSMHCNGQCLLMKKLKAAEKKDQQNPERKLENKTEIFTSTSFFATLQHELSNNKTSFHFSYSSFFPEARPVAIFHPPAIV